MVATIMHLDTCGPTIGTLDICIMVWEDTLLYLIDTHLESLTSMEILVMEGISKLVVELLLVIISIISMNIMANTIQVHISNIQQHMETISTLFITMAFVTQTLAILVKSIQSPQEVISTTTTLESLVTALQSQTLMVSKRQVQITAYSRRNRSMNKLILKL